MIVVEADVRRDHVDVHAERVHVGQTFLRCPPRARRQRLSAVADDRVLTAPRVLLASNRVPVAAVLGCPPEALRRHVRVNVDAPHAFLPVLSRFAATPARTARHRLRRPAPAPRASPARPYCECRARAAACRDRSSTSLPHPCCASGRAPGTAPGRVGPSPPRPAPARRARPRSGPWDRDRTPPCRP